MHSISSVAKTEKNSLGSNSPFLICLDIDIPSVTENVRVVNNNENVTFGGQEYIAFPFSIEEISESNSGEVSLFSLGISNVNNIIGGYIREYDAYVKNNGHSDITVRIMVVNHLNMDSGIPEVEHNTILLSPSINSQTATFSIGGANGYNMSIGTPMTRNNCRFSFKSTQCGYSGTETSCNKTYARCIELNNDGRYGGFPSIGNKGIDV